MAFFDFHLIVIRNRISVFYRSRSGYHARLEQSEFHKRSLTTSTVTDERYVSDFVAGISLHIHTSCNSFYSAREAVIPAVYIRTGVRPKKVSGRIAFSESAKKHPLDVPEKPAITMCILIISLYTNVSNQLVSIRACIVYAENKSIPAGYRSSFSIRNVKITEVLNLGHTENRHGGFVPAMCFLCYSFIVRAIL